ncbi:hypothetical protein D9M70_600670 [compost metagenome]
MADLERWPADQRAAALAEVDAARGPALDTLVERHRAHLWRLLKARNLVPLYGGVSNPRLHGALRDEPPPRKPRGIARALKQRDLFDDKP